MSSILATRWKHRAIRMKLFNHHTHSFFCDGSDHPEIYVKAALKAGFHTLGFSSHAPVPFKNNFAIREEEELKKYVEIIRGLKHQYKGQIDIFLALEFDYIPGLSDGFNHLKNSCGLDYTIGSVHLVKNDNDRPLWFIDGPKRESYERGLKDIFDGNIREAVTAYYKQVNRMISLEKPDIIGHLDKIKMHNKNEFFNEDEKWYRDLIMETIGIIHQSGSIVEVNTRGIYKKRCDDLFPGIFILGELKKRKIPITLSSDAHRPEEIDGFYPETVKILKDLGFDCLMCFSPTGWKGQAL